MAIRLPIPRTDRPLRMSVELGAARYSIRLRWNDRTCAWYLDLLDASGAQLMAGRRVSPRADLLAGVEFDGKPDGALLVKGPDPYRREDLGGDLVIKFVPAAELPAEIGDPTFSVEV